MFFLFQQSLLLSCLLAEKAGFEPAIRFWRIHAFQACLFNHSSISPLISHSITPIPSENECKVRKKYNTQSFLQFRLFISVHTLSTIDNTVVLILILHQEKFRLSGD